MNKLPMSAKQIERREYEMVLQRSLIESGRFPSCISCEHWGNKNQQSCSKYNMVPPAEVIAVGCVDHDFIPF